MIKSKLTHLDKSILENLEAEFEETCEFANCEVDRTHIMTCPICPATENLCDSHATYIRNAKPGEHITFNRSCNHRVPMADCALIKIR